MIATDFDDFIIKMINAERAALNGDAGQKMTNELLKLKLLENPDMTTEEWEQCKQEFMLFVFVKFLENDKELQNEFAAHWWEKLREED